MLNILPYLALGMAVVNVEYRLGGATPAPAAVEDCRCALRWIVRNADRYKFDANRIVVTGMSAGGHLSLMTGMLPASAGFDRPCPAGNDIRCGRARSVTHRSPRARCSRIRRRVGSASAANVRFRTFGAYLTIWLTI